MKPPFQLLTAALFTWLTGLSAADSDLGDPPGSGVQSQTAPTARAGAPANARAHFTYQGVTYPQFPARPPACPNLPSPLRLDDGGEVLTVKTGDDRFTLAPVTVENGAPLNYARRQWGKGRQVDVDTNDFPTLARTGRHAESELRQTKAITGRPITEITEQGRPGGLSGAGFIAVDEDIVSVLIGDNRLVAALELTHRELARPLFHLWNLLLVQGETGRRQTTHRLRYHGKQVSVRWQGSRGWQDSLFNDEIQGMYEFEVWREMDAAEKSLLDARYPSLTAAERAALANALSRIHSGEMVSYYIQRYGFYEGHTEYRADPLAIAFIFGLKSLPEIERAFPGRLRDALARHFTEQTQ